MKKGILNRKTRVKHLQQFGLIIANLLTEELPSLKTAIDLTEIYSIHFSSNPEGITVISGYIPKNYKIIKHKHDRCFRVKGILVLNKSSNMYEEIELFYQNDTLAMVTVPNAQYFHSRFDLKCVKKGVIEIQNVVRQNPYREITEKLIEVLDEDQKRMLDLKTTFEIEYNGTFYYTILDTEDGNYIAVDEGGKVYRLGHDEEFRIKLVAESPIEFFDIYSGDKVELEELMDK